MVFNISWTYFRPFRFLWVVIIFNGRSRNLKTQCHNKVWYIETYTAYGHIYPLNSLWLFSTFHEHIFLLLDSYELSLFSMEGHEISKRNVIIKFDIFKHTPLMSIFIPIIHFGGFNHFMNLFSSFSILMSYRCFQWKVTKSRNAMSQQSLIYWNIHHLWAYLSP